jgi:hypothetical protein
MAGRQPFIMPALLKTGYPRLPSFWNAADSSIMPVITIIFGALLDLVGTTAWLSTGRQSITALIPAFLGTLLIIAGVLAHTNPGIRKHVMHFAATLGLLGFLGSAKGLLQLPALLTGAEVLRPAAVIAQSITAVLALIFLALCVNSFIAARKNREKASGPIA